MLVYKLFRLKQGKLFPLFINRNVETVMHEWLPAEEHITKGFAVRKGWHCCYRPFAPHLKTELKSGEHRVWVQCTTNELDCVRYNRPESQGGAWVLTQWIKVDRILTPEEVEQINYEYALKEYSIKNKAYFTGSERQRLYNAYEEKKKEDYRRWKESQANE